MLRMKGTERVWLAAESDDEYYAAEWESVGERNCEFYMLIYSRRFSRRNALHVKNVENRCLKQL